MIKLLNKLWLKSNIKVLSSEWLVKRHCRSARWFSCHQVVDLCHSLRWLCWCQHPETLHAERRTSLTAHNVVDSLHQSAEHVWCHVLEVGYYLEISAYVRQNVVSLYWESTYPNIYLQWLPGSPAKFGSSCQFDQVVKCHSDSLNGPVVSHFLVPDACVSNIVTPNLAWVWNIAGQYIIICLIQTTLLIHIRLVRIWQLKPDVPENASDVDWLKNYVWCIPQRSRSVICSQCIVLISMSTHEWNHANFQTSSSIFTLICKACPLSRSTK